MHVVEHLTQKAKMGVTQGQSNFGPGADPSI